jgi:hypothetical protein
MSCGAHSVGVRFRAVLTNKNYDHNLKMQTYSQARWCMPIISAAQEVKIRRILVSG